MENFGVNIFINEIKCFNVQSEFVDGSIPVDQASSVSPDISMQSSVVQGKKIIMNVTLPADATEIYFSTGNIEDDYLGLSFKSQDPVSEAGYYRLLLKGISNPGSQSNELKNYVIIISTNQNIPLNKFELVISCKTANGISNKAIKPLEVISIPPNQENLSLGFKPLKAYTYSIDIKAPLGGHLVYSYNKNTGAETFNNSQSVNSSYSYDPELDLLWIDIDPEFGNFSVDANIEINLSTDSDYINMLFMMVSEGGMDQQYLPADIQQVGEFSAVGTVHLDFNYFANLRNIYVNIQSYRPVSYEMLNPTIDNCANERFEVVPENEESNPGIGLRVCRDCLPEYLFNKITLEVFTKDYKADQISIWLSLQDTPANSCSIWEENNFNNLIISGNKETEIELPDFHDGYFVKNFWVISDSINLSHATLTLIVKDQLGNILAQDGLILQPVMIKKAVLNGKYATGPGNWGHNWLTIQFPFQNVDSSYGFWPTEPCPPHFASIGSVSKARGPFDNPQLNSYDYIQEFYLLAGNMDKILQYIYTVDNNIQYWIYPDYDCATFATRALSKGNIPIPDMNYPRDIEDWIIEFRENN